MLRVCRYTINVCMHYVLPHMGAYNIYVYLSAAYKLLLEPKKRRTSNTTNYCHINQPATLSAPLSAVRPTAVVSKACRQVK